MVLKINIKRALDEKKICISNTPWLLWSCRSDYLLNKDFIIFCGLKIISCARYILPGSHNFIYLSHNKTNPSLIVPCK